MPSPPNGPRPGGPIPPAHEGTGAFGRGNRPRRRPAFRDRGLPRPEPPSLPPAFRWSGWRAPAALACALLLTGRAHAEDFLAVATKVSNGYTRTQLPDGSFAAETYTLKEGGFLSGTVADATIDRLTFATVAAAVAGPLERRKYLPAARAEDAQLLLVVYWGTSRAPAETASATPAAQNTASDLPANPGSPMTTQPGFVPFRYQEGSYAGQLRALEAGYGLVQEQDARMLGYASVRDPDLLHYRYFIVLLAYDLPELRATQKKKLLWEARFSIDQHRNAFDRELGPMLAAASPYFGRDSGGMRHDPVPEGRVEIGEPRSLDDGADPGLYAALSPDGTRVAYLLRKRGGVALAVADLDRGELVAATALAGPGGRPVRVTWPTARQVVVALGGGGSLAFGPDGRPLDPEAGRAKAEGWTGGAGDPGAQTQAEHMLPARRVSVLASDQARQRYLVFAAPAASPGRYYVIDRANGLLYEVGRSYAVR